MGSRRNASAETAKNRLQVLVSYDREAIARPDFLALMQKELLEVVRKYVPIDTNKVSVDIDRRDDISLLEVNIELPAQMARPQLV
jgi:cell division topological specificity factor